MPIDRLEDPIELFERWYDEALARDDIDEPTAVTLATVDDTGAPFARIVLLKDVDERGFTFFTNTQSVKGQHLATNPRAALCFYWMPLARQVRIRGAVETVSTAEADAYFASRPRESQIGAWASAQSQLLDDRTTLEKRFYEIENHYAGHDIPRPPHWSGYRVIPDAIEFWQRMPHRLHDRLEYTRKGDTWHTRLLNP
jgi:pyridoxamine 5'-phosphate oxidase